MRPSKEQAAVRPHFDFAKAGTESVGRPAGKSRLAIQQTVFEMDSRAFDGVIEIHFHREVIHDDLKYRRADPLARTQFSPNTRVGAIMDAMRDAGAQRSNPAGLRSSSPSMLFNMKPQPGTIYPQPSPFERVIDAISPPSSIILICVVPRVLAACDSMIDLYAASNSGSVWVL